MVTFIYPETLKDEKSDLKIVKLNFVASALLVPASHYGFKTPSRRMDASMRGRIS